MNIHINKNTLFSALSYTQIVLDRYNTNSYYSYFILQAEDSFLSIKSADIQTTYEQKIEKNEENNLEIKNKGAVLLPGIKIYNIMQHLPEGKISIEKKENNVIIKPSNNINDISFTVRTRAMEDYPNIHKSIPENNHHINIAEFYKIINNTSFAASSDYRNPSMFLTGILLEVKENHLIAVATDRNRISVSKMEVSFAFETGEKDIIVPSKTIPVIKKLIQEGGQQISIAIDGEKMYFQNNNILITTSLISGKYYDYSRIIPKKERNIIKVDKHILKVALDRVSSIEETKKEAIITFTAKKNELLITSEKQEQGRAVEKIKAQIEGKEGSFSVKSQFIQEPLQVIHSDDVIIEYGDEKRDLIKIISTENDKTLHITAPFNV